MGAEAGTFDSELAPRIRHWSPPAPDVLVARFGTLVIALDGNGLHIALLDPRLARQ